MMYRKICTTIVMVTLLYPAFGQTVESPVSDIVAESSVEYFSNGTSVSGIFDRIGFAPPVAKNQTLNRPTFRLTRSVREQISGKHWSFPTKEESALLHPVLIPKDWNPRLGNKGRGSSLITFLSKGGPGCNPLELATPEVAADGRVRSFLTAECQCNASGNDFDEFVWEV